MGAREATPAARHPWTRMAAAAGEMYPADADELRSMVREFLREGELRRRDFGVAGAEGGAGGEVGAGRARGGGGHPRALIAPHAGYRYSGAVAGSAYALLPGWKGSRVLLIGPAHFVEFRGLATVSCAWFETPLGRVPVDLETIERLRSLPGMRVRDEAHAREHSLEVQLPFLQETLERFQIVPVVFGLCGVEEMAALLRQAWDDRTLVVISSDLSHYHGYEEAQRIDRLTADAILGLDAERIGPTSACGRMAIAGLLRVAREVGLEAQLLDLRNSGDTGGKQRAEVVGYGAFSFFERGKDAA